MKLSISSTLDNENKLGDIFWCDGGPRADYALFGDAIAFDKNISNKRLRQIIRRHRWH